jgi:hypothetical protein
MSIGAIPFEAIDRYAVRYGYNGDEFDEFHRLIRATDAAFLEEATAKKQTP